MNSTRKSASESHQQTPQKLPWQLRALLVLIGLSVVALVGKLLEIF